MWKEVLLVGLSIVGGAGSWYLSQRSRTAGVGLFVGCVVLVVALGRLWNIDLSG
jgi:hypothetical protein